jgi:hypothetical protein
LKKWHDFLCFFYPEIFFRPFLKTPGNANENCC